MVRKSHDMGADFREVTVLTTTFPKAPAMRSR